MNNIDILLENEYATIIEKILNFMNNSKIICRTSFVNFRRNQCLGKSLSLVITERIIGPGVTCFVSIYPTYKNAKLFTGAKKSVYHTNIKRRQNHWKTLGKFQPEQIMLREIFLQHVIEKKYFSFQ